MSNMAQKRVTFKITASAGVFFFKKIQPLFETDEMCAVREGNCMLYLKVEREHTNVFGTFHGGLTATIADVISYFALESHPKFHVSSKPPFNSGVTSNLHMSYLNPVKNGEDVFFKAETVDIRQHLALVEISVTNSDFTKTYARGSVNISFLPRI